MQRDRTGHYSNLIEAAVSRRFATTWLTSGKGIPEPPSGQWPGAVEAGGDGTACIVHLVGTQFTNSLQQERLVHQ